MAVEILIGDCREQLRNLPERSVHCCVTSPPYFGLRDYGHEGQMGLEPTPDEFVAGMVAVFAEVKRVLRDDGTLWLNLGDSYGRGARVDNVNDGKRGTNAHAAISAASAYANTPRAHMREKDLLGIPWRVAFALQADGWYLRQDIIWSKPNPMPESVRDRCTKAHEYVFLLSKSPTYCYDADAVREPHVTFGPDSKMKGGRNHIGKRGGTPEAGKNAGDSNCHDGRWDQAFHPKGRNRRSVWTVSTKPFKGAHFATFPQDLIEPCILAGCPVDGTVLDPFFGAGTTGLVAKAHGRNAIGIELNPEYAAMARARIDAPVVVRKAKKPAANDNRQRDLFAA